MEGLRERDGKLAMIVSKGYVRWSPARRSTNLQPSLSRQINPYIHSYKITCKNTKNEESAIRWNPGGGGGGTRLIWWTGVCRWNGYVTFFKNIPKHMGYGFAGKIPKHAPHFCNFTVDTIYFRPFRRYTQKRHFLEQKPLIIVKLMRFLSLFPSFYTHAETA